MENSKTKGRPLVSFLVAAYNEEDYVEDCVDSCLNQDYSNVEVCVTDDGSTDNTWKFLQRRYGSNPQVRLDRFEKNRGKIHAFNVSFKNASGNYLALIGADDVNMPDRISKCLDFINNQECDLVCGNVLYCDEKLAPIAYGQRKNLRPFVSLKRTLRDNVCMGGTMLLNRRIAGKCFPIPATLMFEDWWISFNAALFGRIGYLNHYMIRYRQHSANDNSDTDTRSAVDRVTKDFQRQGPYYDEFIRVLSETPNTEKRVRWIKVTQLSKIYRELFLEENLIRRFHRLSNVIKLASFDLLFPASLAILFFGNRLYRLKRLSAYQRIFLLKPPTNFPDTRRQF